MNEILRNFPDCDEFSDDSFLSIWHEKGTWCDSEYWKLDKAIYELSEQYNSDSIPRNLAWPLMRVFSYMMVSIQAHYDENDEFRVLNLNEDEIFDFRERFQLVVEGFFKGDMPSNSTFNIVNPLL